jgi:hypothetical protein
MDRTKRSDTLQTSLLAITQTAVGCGVGLLVAGKLGRSTQKITAATLFSIGVLVSVPVVAGLVMRVLNRPESARGARRRLDSIRGDSGAGFPDDTELF